MSYERCIMILADGARADRFEALLAAGVLPQIARHIVAPGGYRRGVTAFPSTTGPAYMPFLTGCLPGTCNVPGIRWMDKAQYRPGTRRGVRSYCGIETFKANGDMAPQVTTLFQHLQPGYNIFSPICRGIANRTNITRLMRIWYWYYAHLTDRWDFVDAAAQRKLEAVVARDFRFCFVVFPGIDEYSHLDDPMGDETTTAYQRIDQAVGAAAQQLASRGQLEGTLWWIVSDHGLSATHTHFCIDTFLADHRLRAVSYPKIYRRDATAANMMSGNAMSNLYFRHHEGWDRPVTDAYLEAQAPGLLEALVAETAIDVVAVRTGDQGIRVLTKRGAALLRMVGTRVQYQALRGDPLAVGLSEALLSPEESLARTMDGPYPDGPYQLAHVFQSPRAGDVIVSAAPGYDLRLKYEIPEHHGSHGSLHREHMHIPIFCSAPLRPGPMRSVDVFPSTLQLLGAPIPDAVDGKSQVEGPHMLC